MSSISDTKDQDKSMERPQSDGMVERFNRTVGSMMKQYVNDTQTDWDEYLPLCSLAYNSTIHSSTGYSPNFLMFGRDFRLPLELVVPVPDFEPNEEAGDEDIFVQNLKNTLRTVYGAVREKLQAATAYQKSYYDKRSRHQEFKVGDSVWLYNPIRKKGRTPKLDMMWQGPYGIVNLIGEVLAEIRSGKRNKSRIVHVDKLALTRRPIHFKWIKELPKKREAKGADEVLVDVKHLYKDEAKDKDEKSLATESQDVVTEDVTTTEEEQKVQDEEKWNKEHSKGKNGKKVKFKRDVKPALRSQKDESKETQLKDKSTETHKGQEDESAETYVKQKDGCTVTRVGRKVRRPKRYQEY